MDDEPESTTCYFTTPIVTDCITFPGKDGWSVRIYYSTPQRVEVNPEMSFDAAAKHFWNAVARGVGQKPLFDW